MSSSSTWEYRRWVDLPARLRGGSVSLPPSLSLPPPLWGLRFAAPPSQLRRFLLVADIRSHRRGRNSEQGAHFILIMASLSLSRYMYIYDLMFSWFLFATDSWDLERRRESGGEIFALRLGDDGDYYFERRVLTDLCGRVGGGRSQSSGYSRTAGTRRRGKTRDGLTPSAAPAAEGDASAASSRRRILQRRKKS